MAKTKIVFKDSDSKSKGGKSVRKTSKKDSGGFFGFIKKIIMTIMFLISLALVGIVLMLMNFNKCMDWIGTKFVMQVDRAQVNMLTIVKKKAKGSIDLDLKNNLIFPVVLDNVKFDMMIGDYQIAQNMVATFSHKMEAFDSAKAPINVEMDSIKVRRALQKVFETKANRALQRIFQHSENQSAAYSDDIKDVVNLKALASLHLNVFGIQIPFHSDLKHNIPETEETAK